MELKEVVNTNRILLMPKARNLDYLIVNLSENKTTILGIKYFNEKIKDVMLIKTIFNMEIEDIIIYILNLSKEFNNPRIIVDVNDDGYDLYEKLNYNKQYDIVPIRTSNYIGKLFQIEIVNDIENGNLRFLQTYINAKNNYTNTFSGYSETLFFHKETNMLIEEINNVDINTQIDGNGLLRRIGENNPTGINRLYCLLLFYLYLHHTVK